MKKRSDHALAVLDFHRAGSRASRPWKNGGITESSLSAARKKGSMPVVISGGNLYIEVYRECPQSGNIFIPWGLLLLLERKFGQDHEDDQAPAPFFSYCTTNDTLDVPFPDLSFWGWPEVDIPPWEEQSQPIVPGSWEKWISRLKAVTAMQRQVNGTTLTFVSMLTLLSIFNIYVEGAAWSASLKYRMAEAIGRRGQDFITQELTMDHVYSYMVELLSQYAKLQRCTPTVPHGTQILCKDVIKSLLMSKYSWDKV
ncbi:uncharacterized protein LOC112344403 [Selaginella moellendorffii]|uniref:uncharacterized protein LOC112344403 n=1 Tax=Selaginella moellendorffii TaxID=88036 RepID=UPI000D1CF833|nr:uncharacterized protein LOC112344403 [Selaginella moellendorffii]|eukprot:XP_024524827.1 uncharacterized protein LOC112344403 [Selaginella moellendorffii]